MLLEIETLKIIFFCILCVLGLVLIFLGVEAIRILKQVRKLMDRVDFITDAREWLNFLRVFKSRRRS